MLGQPSISHRTEPLAGLDVLIGAGFGVRGDMATDKDQGTNFEPGGKYVADSTLAAVDARKGGRYRLALRTFGQAGEEVLAVAADLRKVAIMDGNVDHRPAVVGGASIYPFCWSILLSARAHGLGGVMTTFLSRAEPAAAPLLGLPPDHALAATIMLGHPVHQPTKLSRRPVDEFTTIDRFDGEPFR
jgi:nitroreductase